MRNVRQRQNKKSQKRRKFNSKNGRPFDRPSTQLHRPTYDNTTTIHPCRSFALALDVNDQLQQQVGIDREQQATTNPTAITAAAAAAAGSLVQQFYHHEAPSFYNSVVVPSHHRILFVCCRRHDGVVGTCDDDDDDDDDVSN